MKETRNKREQFPVACNECSATERCIAKTNKLRGPCRFYQKPKEGFKLIELALQHPSGLNAALSALQPSIDVKIDLWLR